MNFKKLAIATSVFAAFMAPSLSQAAESSLNGWGAAFAKAYGESQGTSLKGEGQGQAAGMLSVQKPVAQAPATPSSPSTGEGMAKVEGMAKATADAGAKFSSEQKDAALGKVDQAYSQVGDAAEQVSGKVNGVLSKVGDMGSQGLSVSHEGNLAGNLNVADMVTGSLAASTAVTAQLAGVSQLASVATLTSSLMSNVLASRPTTLTGLLR